MLPGWARLQPLRAAVSFTLALVHALAIYPIGVPGRIALMLPWVSSLLGRGGGGEEFNNEEDVQDLLRADGQGREFESGPVHMFLSALRIAQVSIGWVPSAEATEPPLVLVCPRTECVVCGGELGHMQKATRHASPTVYTERGKLTAALYKKYCSKCKAVHNMSYALLADGSQKVYSGAEDRAAVWWQVGRDTIFAVTLIERFQAQLLHSHTGALPFCEEYRHLTGTGDVDSMRKTLMHAFLARELVSWLRETGNTDLTLRICSEGDLDASLLWALRADGGKLEKAFVSKWGEHHAKCCRKPREDEDWCKCFIIDGHMKCKRLVCKNMCRRQVKTDIGLAVLGCTGTPLPGSRFCAECRPYASKRAGPITENAQRSSVALSAPEDCSQAQGSASAGGGSQLADAVGSDGASDAEDELEPVMPGEENVYLVKQLVPGKHRVWANTAATRRANPQHSECIKAGLNQYLVEWAGYSADYNTFECDCHVSQQLKEAYWADHSAAATAIKEGGPAKRTRAALKHAGAIADELQQPGARGGDFKANPEAKDAEKLLETHDCNTLKSDQYEDQKRTTAGALFMVSACGLFIGDASACAPLPRR